MCVVGELVLGPDFPYQKSMRMPRMEQLRVSDATPPPSDTVNGGGRSEKPKWLVLRAWALGTKRRGAAAVVLTGLYKHARVFLQRFGEN